MQPLTTLDAAFVHLESGATPMHVGALFVLEPPAPARTSFVARLRRHVRMRLGACPVFTRRLAPVPLNLANPLWDEAGEVDLAWHVRVTHVPAPGRHRELDRCVEALHEVPLDRDRPLWQLHVLEGLAGGRVGLYLKVHHAGLDGATAQVFLRCFTDDAPPSAWRTPRSAAGAHGASGAHGAWAALLAGGRHQASQLARLPGTVRELIEGISSGGTGASGATGAGAGAGAVGAARDARARRPGHANRSRSGSGAPPGRAPPTPFNVPITAPRAFASADAPLAGVRALAKARGVTINDVILAACGGAVRRWLDARDALPDETLLAAVPVSLRAPGDANLGIRVSFATVPLHTEVPSTTARLTAIATDTRRTKDSSHGALPVPRDLPSIGVPWLLGGLAWLAARPAVAARVPLPWNVLVSNVVGPPAPLYVLGARVLTYTPVSIPYHGLALNVTVYSYSGRLYFGLTAARDVVPDVTRLARRLIDELRGLQRAGSPRAARRRTR